MKKWRNEILFMLLKRHHLHGEVTKSHRLGKNIGINLWISFGWLPDLKKKKHARDSKYYRKTLTLCFWPDCKAIYSIPYGSFNIMVICMLYMLQNVIHLLSFMKQFRPNLILYRFFISEKVAHCGRNLFFSNKISFNSFEKNTLIVAFDMWSEYL